MKKLFHRALALSLILTLIISLVGCTKPKPKAEIDYAIDDGRIKNVILIIGDGMGEAQLDAGELMYGKEFAFRDELTKFYSETNSISLTDGKATEVTDSSASATALATGILTYNKFAGKNTKGEDLETILDIASASGKSTGFVTTDSLTGATPAGFTAHTLNRNLENEIIKSQIKSGVDLLIGQYNELYNNYKSPIANSYNYFTAYDEDGILASKKVGALCNVEIETDAEGAIELRDAAELAIEYLSSDRDGFVLVIEQAHIDKNCHNKNFEGAAKSANSLNDTVEAVMNFAKDRNDTAVIITADHETCGLEVSKSSDTYKSKATIKTGSEISYSFTSTYHTDTPVPVYTYGFTPVPQLCPTFESAERIKNSEVFLIVRDLVLYS